MWIGYTMVMGRFNADADRTIASILQVRMRTRMMRRRRLLR
jgi:hypothetical protein